MGGAVSCEGERRWSKRAHTAANPLSSQKRDQRELPSALPDDLLLPIASNFVGHREMDWESLLSVRAVCVSWSRLVSNEGASDALWLNIIDPPHEGALAIGLRGAGALGPRAVSLRGASFSLGGAFEMLRAGSRLRSLRLPQLELLNTVGGILDPNNVRSVLGSVQSRSIHLLLHEYDFREFDGDDQDTYGLDWLAMVDDWNEECAARAVLPCAACACNDVPVGFDCDVCSAPRCCAPTKTCSGCGGCFCTACDDLTKSCRLCARPLSRPWCSSCCSGCRELHSDLCFDCLLCKT